MGFQGNSFVNVSEYLGAIAVASRRTGHQVWSNVELFKGWPEGCEWPHSCGRHPAPFERIKAQMANEEPLVDQLVAWDWHMLRGYPGDGPTNMTVELYDEYKAYIGRGRLAGSVALKTTDEEG